MTDRELLDLAAKAAGIGLGWKDGLPFTGLGSYMPIPWNPRLYDDQAMRLAVKLNMSIQIECESAGAICVQWGFDQSGEAAGSVIQEAPLGGDDYAAARLAIVRAAAEIGRVMP